MLQIFIGHIFIGHEFSFLQCHYFRCDEEKTMAKFGKYTELKAFLEETEIPEYRKV